MDRKLLRRLIFFTAIILAVILSYKLYLYLNESDFQGRNYENIQKVENTKTADAYSFAVIGSAENSIDIFQNKIINKINSDNDINFLISTGDAVLDGSEDKFQILNNTLKRLNAPSIIGVGYREISDDGNIRYYRHFGPFYFSFKNGNDYFIFIDTTGTTSYGLQKDWIKSELQKAEKCSHIFVFMNDSPLKRHGIRDKNFRNFLIDEFSAYKVTGVFSNGTAYDKTVKKGVSYYTGGGAGGLLGEDSQNSDYYYLKVNVTEDNVNVKTVKQPLAAKNVVSRNLEKAWIFIHAIFYAQFINLLLVVFAVLLLLLILYTKVSKDKDYYRDFDETNISMDQDKKLNIAMFTNNYLPFVGGVPISIERLAEALRKRGNNVIIFAPEYPDTESNEDGVYRCKLLHFRKGGNFNFAIANIFSPKIDTEFNKYNFDIVHVHHPFWIGRKGLKLGKKNNIPVVLTYHTRLELYSENLPFGKLLFKNVVSHKMIKKFGQKCDGIIAPTKSAKEYLENVGVSREKIVMPTGLDFSKYETIDGNAVNTLKNDLTPNGEALLCTVSRLSVEKNIDFLIEGLKYIKENTAEKFKCIIIGDGPEKENLQKMIDDYSLNDVVVLLGLIKPEEMPKYYCASDLFVFSSKSETQGMVLLEAMAGKCPVVCVRSSGTDDVVRNDFNGYKTPEDIEKWAEKVICLLENKEKLEIMSENAFSFSKKFSVDKMAQRVEKFYRKLINVKKSR